MPESPERRLRPSAEQIEAGIVSLLPTIAHAGAMATERVSIPGTGISVEVTRPADIDILLDLSEMDPEQNLPYWAEIWPSGVALAAAISRQPDRVAGQRVLELGCGLGITAALAIAAGAHLTATDYAAESLTLTRITTLRHSGQEPESLHQLNWRSDSVSQLVTAGRFPVVLAADVLYERRDVEPLIDAMDVLLDEDGLLWLADPQREPADMLLDRLVAMGWHVESTRWPGPWPDPNDAGVVVRTHLITRPGSSGA